MNQKLLSWFEIPVIHMDRAVKFYELVLGISFEVKDFGALKMAMFPTAENVHGVPGALICNEKFYTPFDRGILLYFSSPGGDLNIDMKTVEISGGKILIPRRQVSESFGFMFVFLDSEGNRMAMHSRT